MGLFALALRLLPIRRIAPLFGQGIGATAYVPLLPPAQRGRAGDLKQVIDVTARYAPFRSDCFPQALVAVTLCRLFRLPFAMHFGIRLDPDKGGQALAAHAWVVSGPLAISGGNRSFGEFNAVGCFVSRNLAGLARQKAR